MFFDEYKGLCEKRGVKPYTVAREIGLGSSNVAVWKSGSTPRPEVLQKIADYFDVSVGALMGYEDIKTPTPVSESGHSAAAIAFMERHPDLTEEDYRFLHEQAELLELRRIHQEKK